MAKASPAHSTLIELIERDPERYGVDGGQLPFLLKILAIGAPLSLQVHPDLAQAGAGFAAEEAAGVPADAFERNYGDPNHKPELLVALTEVTALCGFRPLAEARADLLALSRSAEGAGREALARAAHLCEGGVDPASSRRAFVSWALGGGSEALAAARALTELAVAEHGLTGAEIDENRRSALEGLAAAHPGDPGLVVSLLLHLVRLAPGEAIYLAARQLHAYLAGVGVEVMAASDNVLRAGLTEKHVDVAELLSIADFCELEDPRFPERAVAPGLVAWEPGVRDFRLLRARLQGPTETDEAGVESVELDAEYPLVVIVTSGRVRVERLGAEFAEVASVRRGQSLYVSAGEPIELSGVGEVFIATVGARPGGSA